MPTKYVYSGMSHAIGMTGVIEYWGAEGADMYTAISAVYWGRVNNACASIIENVEISTKAHCKDYHNSVSRRPASNSDVPNNLLLFHRPVTTGCRADDIRHLYM